MSNYWKFILALAVALVQVVLTLTGVDLSQWLNDTIAVLVAFGVLTVPNIPPRQ